MKKKRSHSLPVTTEIKQHTIPEPQHVINPVTPMSLQPKTQAASSSATTTNTNTNTIEQPIKRAQINISNLDRARLKKSEHPERHSMPGSLESHLREAYLQSLQEYLKQ